MSDSVDSLVALAPAKVNLTLHILGKRPDGYHELDTVMQKLDLSDSITLHRMKRPGVQLSCPGSDLPEDNTNLVWKAADAFLQEAGLIGECGVSIILEKKIPIAAGLGGGSSDAASVLTGLDRLFHTEISEETLLRLGKSLGADVPFFVVSSPAVHATGIGDKMTPQKPLDNCSLLLVNPGFSVSTAWVYENFTLTRAVKDSKLSDSRENDSVEAQFYSLFNDLEVVTIQQYPELGTIKRFMLDNGASGALMSGSGPTVFGVFPDQAGSEASCLRKCAEKLAEKYGQGVFVTRPVGSESENN